MLLSKDGQSWLAEYVELQYLINLLSIETNPLGVIPGQQSNADSAIKDTWKQLDTDQQQHLRTMLTAVSRPRQTIHLAWTVGEAHYMRVTLARIEEQEDLVWLARQPDGQYQLQLVTVEELNLLLNDIVQMDFLGEENSNRNMSATAVLAVLGTTELMRQRYHQSMLLHLPIDNGLTIKQLRTVLADATKEDIRWPLCFWEKNLPVEFASVTAQIEDAIPELDRTGWLKPAAEDKYILTDNTLYLAKEMLNEKAKLSLVVATTDGQDIIVEDSLLLVRGPQALWLYYVLGEQGGIGQVGRSGWKALSEALLSPPEIEPVNTVSVDADNNAARFCPHCGNSILPGTNFCGSCGGSLG
ncbi:MAG: zinc ribbon domain-containing protein [Syntrophomonadaceae bacterium]|jgi:hypothetical protein